MAETTLDSQIKLTIKFFSSSGNPKEYVLYVPRSKKRQHSDPSPSSSDVGCTKRCKVVASESEEHSSITKLETTTAIIAKHEEVAKTINGCEEKEKKQEPLMMRKRVVKKEPRISYEKKDSGHPIKIGGTTDKCSVVKEKWRLAKTHGSEEKAKEKEPRISCEGNCKKKDSDDQYPKKTVAVVKNGSTTHQHRDIMKEKERVSCKEECRMKKNMKVQKSERVMVVMDHSKKMQCWVMLKRLMTGRDSWVFKEPFMGLETLNNKDYSFHASSMSKKPTCLKDIESKLNKFLYTNPHEFAEDVRVVLSYGFLHPPRNDIYKIARRVSDDFEVSWKSLKEKWMKDLKAFQKKKLMI